MANWEKLIEEHYSKKNKIDENTIFELIEQALLAEGYQDSEVIKNHPSMRLSTKGTKKAGGDPYDEDPPKARSKSAPAGFGALEEESLEESNRGVAHKDKLGEVITDKSGDELTLSDFSFFEVGDKSPVALELKNDDDEVVLKVEVNDEIKDTKTLVAVANELTKGPEVEVLYQYPEKITKSAKAVIIVFAKNKQGDLKSFVKYTKSSPFWQEKDFTLKTGYAFSGTQSSKEILDVGPDLFTTPSTIRPVKQLPSALSSDVLKKLNDKNLVKSIKDYLNAAVAGSGSMPLLKFDSEDSRKKYLPSIYKYFSEVMGPIFLATKNASLLTGPIAEAEKALLIDPFKIKGFAANNGIYYPTSKTENLKDSVLAFGEQEVYVSSKAKSGANPSLAELYKGLNSLPETDKNSLVTDYGPTNALNIYNKGQDPLGIIEILADPQYTYATMPCEAAKSLGFTTPNTANGWDDAKELMKTMAKNGWKSKAWAEIVADKNNEAFISELREYKKNINAGTTKPNYSEARHILAGLAIEVQNTVNDSGEITKFAKAMYNRFPLVQIYAKKGAYKPTTAKDGSPALESTPLKLIYPAQFNGKMFIDAKKNYFATGNKGKMTIKIVY